MCTLGLDLAQSPVRWQMSRAITEETHLSRTAAEQLVRVPSVCHYLCNSSLQPFVFVLQSSLQDVTSSLYQRLQLVGTLGPASKAWLIPCDS